MNSSQEPQKEPFNNNSTTEFPKEILIIIGDYCDPKPHLFFLSTCHSLYGIIQNGEQLWKILREKWAIQRIYFETQFLGTTVNCLITNAPSELFSDLHVYCGSNGMITGYNLSYSKIEECNNYRAYQISPLKCVSIGFSISSIAPRHMLDIGSEVLRGRHNILNEFKFTKNSYSSYCNDWSKKWIFPELFPDDTDEEKYDLIICTGRLIFQK